MIIYAHELIFKFKHNWETLAATYVTLEILHWMQYVLPQKATATAEKSLLWALSCLFSSFNDTNNLFSYNVLKNSYFLLELKTMLFSYDKVVFAQFDGNR